MPTAGSNFLAAKGIYNAVISAMGREGNGSRTNINKKFCGGFQRDTYSAVLNNTHRDGKSFEASYAILALQMLPHAVGFFKRAPFDRRRQKKVSRIPKDIVLSAR